MDGTLNVILEPMTNTLIKDEPCGRNVMEKMVDDEELMMIFE